MNQRPFILVLTKTVCWKSLIEFDLSPQLGQIRLCFNEHPNKWARLAVQLQPLIAFVDLTLFGGENGLDFADQFRSFVKHNRLADSPALLVALADPLSGQELDIKLKYLLCNGFAYHCRNFIEWKNKLPQLSNYIRKLNKQPQTSPHVYGFQAAIEARMPWQNYVD